MSDGDISTQLVGGQEPADVTVEEGELAALMLGITSCLGSVWFLVSWFLFIPNTYDLSYYGSLPLPLIWMWGGLGNANYVWTALNYLFIFLTFGLASVPEFAGWFMYMNNYNVKFLSWYATTIGYWVSLIGFFFPMLWSLLQLALAPVSGSSTAEFFNNSIFNVIVGLVMWLFIGLVHIFFAPTYHYYVNNLWAITGAAVVAEAEVVEEVVEEEDAEEEDLEDDEEVAEEAF